MAAETEFPSMGATIFVGLTGVALITQGPSPEDLANPFETHTQTVFEIEPDPVQFAGFLSWSAPLVLQDKDLAGTNGPDQRPQRGAPLIRFTQMPTTHAAVAVTSDPPQAASVPVSMSINFNFDQIATLSSKDTPRRVEIATKDQPLEQPTHMSLRNAEWSAALKHVQSFQLQPTEVASFLFENTDSGERTVSGYKPKLVRILPDEANRSPRVAIPVRVTGNAVYLREAPSRSASPVTKFNSGTIGLVLEFKDDWRLVAFDDVTGWMFGEYLNALGQ